jgi:hypothetical protein
MKDNLLIFALAFVLWGWLNLHITRAKKKNRVWKETKEIAEQRLREATQSNVKKERKTTTIKNLGAMPQTNRNFNMCAYPYLQKESRNGKERRKSRLPVGITFEYVDRREIGEILYNGTERRSGMERRGMFWDRRKPKVPCYYSARN